MNEEQMLELVDEISEDLDTVKKWELKQGEPVSTEVVLQDYEGKGEKWTHRLVVWSDTSFLQTEHPDGASTKGLTIVRFTPEIAVKALKLVRASE